MDVECETALEWQAADLGVDSVALGIQSELETELVAVGTS